MLMPRAADVGIDTVRTCTTALLYALQAFLVNLGELFRGHKVKWRCKVLQSDVFGWLCLFSFWFCGLVFFLSSCSRPLGWMSDWKGSEPDLKHRFAFFFFLLRFALYFLFVIKCISVGFKVAFFLIKLCQHLLLWDFFAGKISEVFQ